MWANAFQNLDPVPSRQHPIEHNEIECLCIESEKAVFTGLGDSSIISLATQTRPDGVGGFAVVFDDQNLRHVAQLSLFRPVAARFQF